MSEWEPRFSWYTVSPSDYISPTGWANRKEAETHKKSLQTANPFTIRVVPASEASEYVDDDTEVDWE